MRAIRKIAKGEEITISYVSPVMPWNERASSLERYGFGCDCTLCEFERNESPSRKKKVAVLADPKSAMKATIVDLKDRIEKINHLRPTGPNPKDKMNICTANLLSILIARCIDNVEVCLLESLNVVVLCKK